MKKSLVVLACLLMLSPHAIGQEISNLKLRDIMEQGAKQLSVEELRQLLPDSKVRSVSGQGNTRFWKNNADGKFIASTDNRYAGRGLQGQGSWHIGDNGTYCVLLEWSGKTEQWCRFIFKGADKYYGVKSVSNQAGEVYEFEFSK